MITLQSASSIITIITLLISYCVSVSISGAFRAWVADKMGDDTGRVFGFLTLNPFVHISIWLG